MNSSAQPSPSGRRKAEMRARLRSARRNQPRHVRRIADRRICSHLQHISAFRQAATVAVYLSCDGEPSLEKMLNAPRNANKRFLVPIISQREMRFAKLDRDQRMRQRKFGIHEPIAPQLATKRSIEIVLLPLVGFDDSGNRLGMGGGFYDRFFEYLLTRNCYVRPRLIGIAYDVQRVASVPTNSLDVPLWGIVTESGFRRVRQEAQH